MIAPAESVRKPRWPQPGQLWSLWDMLNFAAEDFYITAGEIRNVRHQLENVKAMDAADFMSKPICTLPVVQAALTSFAQSFVTAAPTLGAFTTQTLARRLLADLSEKSEFTYHDFDRALNTLEAAFRAELSTCRFYVLDPRLAALAGPKESGFGAVVEARFAVAIKDMYETGECLAFERGTAAVFHSMRVLEVGLKALGRELDINYAPSWEAYIRQLNDLLDGSRYGKLTPEQKAKRPFYQQVLGDLVSVKSAWRNPTMHIVRSYDVAEASAICEAVRVLMTHLATELTADPSTVISTGQTEAEQ